MKRRAALQSGTSFLSDIDLLLGVYDKSRMGGLRFKMDKEEAFLDSDADHSLWLSMRFFIRVSSECVSLF